jgi:outer membrane protein insertion porin family
LTDRLGELGYAFANVSPIPKIDRTKRVVDFQLQVDPGRRVYVRRINISGNAKTRDEVIRREMRQFEASWYDSERINISRNRIDRLGYFAAVEVEPEAVSGVGDQVDVNVRVAERPLGSISLGAGFSSSDKLVLSGSIAQQNFLGTGTNAALEVSTSKINRTLAFSYLDPYWTDDGLSRGFSVYTRRYDASESDGIGQYSINSLGLSVNFGIPVSEVDRISVGAGYERQKVGGSPSASSNPDLVDFIRKYPDGAETVLLSAGFAKDTRDSGINPSKGTVSSIGVEYATPLGDYEYARLVLGHQRYYSLSRIMTYAFNAEVGVGQGLGGDEYPATKYFFAGGIGSIRGFASGTVGPKSVDGLALGGTKRLILNNELLFPIPGMAKDRTIRLFAFVDAGNVWGVNSSANGGIRASSGFGLSWLSPAGPLRLSVGNTLKREPSDRTERIQFQIGTGF